MGFRGSRVQIPPSRLSKLLQQMHLGGEQSLAPFPLRHFLRQFCPRFSPCHLERRRRFSVRGAGPHFASKCTISLASSPRQSCRDTPSVFFADGRCASRYSQLSTRSAGGGTAPLSPLTSHD